MPHRPLSDWVARIALTGDVPATWNPRSGLNDGTSEPTPGGCTATAGGAPPCPWTWGDLGDIGYSALALVNENATEALVELDEMARPIPVSAEGAQVISDLEDSWPNRAATPEQRRVLESEKTAVRSLLLARLAADGDPAPEMFDILPWDRVERLARETADGLRGRTSADVRLRRGRDARPARVGTAARGPRRSPPRPATPPGSAMPEQCRFRARWYADGHGMPSAVRSPAIAK